MKLLQGHPEWAGVGRSGKPIPHGTLSGYKLGCRCEPCRDVKRRTRGFDPRWGQPCAKGCGRQTLLVGGICRVCSAAERRRRLASYENRDELLWVPTVLIARVLRAWLDEQTVDRYAAITAAAKIAGTSPRQIHAIVVRERPNIGIDLADRILLGIDRHYLWYSEPLSHWYAAKPGEIPPGAKPTLRQLEAMRQDSARRRELAAAKRQQKGEAA